MIRFNQITLFLFSFLFKLGVSPLLSNQLGLEYAECMDRTYVANVRRLSADVSQNCSV